MKYQVIFGFFAIMSYGDTLAMQSNKNSVSEPMEQTLNALDEIFRKTIASRGKLQPIEKLVSQINTHLNEARSAHEYATAAVWEKDNIDYEKTHKHLSSAQESLSQANALLNRLLENPKAKL